MSKYIPRLLEHYNKEIKNSLLTDLKINNSMRVPKLLKISLNIGFGQARMNENQLKAAVDELTNIAGQKAVVTKSKKAISNFKIRENDPVGISVTLRREHMYEFLDRFISIAAPRIRDFRGLPNRGFDGRGNYNFGVTEQIIFPEIDYDKVNQIRGLNITIVTTAKTDEDAFELLLAMGMPIRKKVVQVEEEEVAA